MRKLYTLFILISLSFSYAYAQVKTITGTVKDRITLENLAGVTIIASDGKSTQTNSDGFFTLEVPTSGTISARYLGYIATTINITSQNSYNILMDSDDQALDEVVVIGYGRANKRDLTGSITQIKGEDIVDKPGTNPIANLQGKIASNKFRKTWSRA